MAANDRKHEKMTDSLCCAVRNPKATPFVVYKRAFSPSLYRAVTAYPADGDEVSVRWDNCDRNFHLSPRHLSGAHRVGGRQMEGEGRGSNWAKADIKGQTLAELMRGQQRMSLSVSRAFQMLLKNSGQEQLRMDTTAH